MRFWRFEDRVRINVPGQFNSLTLAAWVNVEGLVNPMNAIVMADKFDRVGQIHWQLRQNGQCQFTVCGGKFGNFDYFSPPVVQTGKLHVWRHLAVAADGKARTITFYVDGHAVGTRTSSTSYRWLSVRRRLVIMHRASTRVTARAVLSGTDRRIGHFQSAVEFGGNRANVPCEPRRGEVTRGAWS